MITSTNNAQIKDIMNLMKKSGERKRRGLFVIEGIRMFEEIPRERLQKVYASESFAGAHPALLAGKNAEIVSDGVYKTMSDTKNPQGILALVEQLSYSMEDLMGDGKRPPCLVVLENLQDPGNLGTIIRTAEGAGASGVLLSKDCVDLYNPKVIRSTMGALFRMPFLYVEDIRAAVEELQKQGIRCLAAHLRGEHFYTEEDLTGPLAILIGNEGNGLTEELANQADTYVKIPMEGQLESLNAAVSAAVLLYEAYRQRGKI